MLAVQNELLITKIQEQLADFKNQTHAEIQVSQLFLKITTFINFVKKIDSGLNSTNASIEKRFTEFADNLAKNSMSGIHEKIQAIQKMEESQNYVLKDCHEKVQSMLKRIVELERTDFDDKFSNITRRMIADVVREYLTPIQMNINLELKSIKKVVEDHVYSMEQF